MLEVENKVDEALNFLPFANADPGLREGSTLEVLSQAPVTGLDSWLGMDDEDGRRSGNAPPFLVTEANDKIDGAATAVDSTEEMELSISTKISRVE